MEMLFLADVAPGSFFIIYGFFFAIVIGAIVLLVVAIRLIGNIASSNKKNEEGVDEDERDV